MAKFAPIRADAERRAKLISAASAKKATAQEACGLIKAYVAAEAKVVSYVTTKQTACNIPPEVPNQLKANQASYAGDAEAGLRGGSRPGAGRRWRPRRAPFAERGARFVERPDRVALGAHRRQHLRHHQRQCAVALIALRSRRSAHERRKRSRRRTRPATGSTGSRRHGRVLISASPAMTGRSARGCCCCRAAGPRRWPPASRAM